MIFADSSTDHHQSAWEWFVGTPLTIVLIILVALVLRWLINGLIKRATRAMESRVNDRPSRHGAGRVLRAATGLDGERRKQRAATMGSLLRSVTTIVIGVIVAMTIMQELDIPVAPLLASAGVTGVALGFGAQSLVKDFLSGIFMIVEDQYGVGDVIDTGQAIGTVQEVTLRITKLRDGDGVIWYVRNGEVIRIGNRSQGWGTALIDIPIASDQSIPKALEVLEKVASAFSEEDPWQGLLLEPLTVNGVQSVAPGLITLRITAKCVPNEQYGVQREILERAKIALDAAGIHGPSLLPGYGINRPPAP